jgi:hypothetical protein
MNEFRGAVKTAAALLASATLCAALSIAVAAADESPPRWAYPENNRSYKPPADDGILLHVPHGTAGYARSDYRNQGSTRREHELNRGSLPVIAGLTRQSVPRSRLAASQHGCAGQART